MSMKIQNQGNLSFQMKLFDRLSSGVNTWMTDTTWFDPSSIDVNPTQVTSIIAINYSIGIQHRKTTKYEFSPQILSLECLFS